MGIARVCSQFWTHPKRLKLERLTAGKWAKTPVGGSTNAGEACARILAWLDSLNDTRGFVPDIQDMADAAGWTSEASILSQALVDAGLAEDKNGDIFWHDFATLNGSAIRQRNYRRNGSHNEAHNEKRGSGSGSGSGTSSGTKTPPKPPKGGKAGKRKELTPEETEEREGWIAAFVEVWNRDTRPFNVRRMTVHPDLESVRGKLIVGFVEKARKVAETEKTPFGKLISLAVIQVCDQEWVANASDPLQVDWFVRKQNVDRHLEIGLEAVAR